MPAGGHLAAGFFLFITTDVHSPGLTIIENGLSNRLNWFFNLYPESATSLLLYKYVLRVDLN